MKTLPIVLLLLTPWAPASAAPQAPSPSPDDPPPAADDKAPRQESPAERARREREERMRAATGQAAPILGIDGEPLVPGALPESASPEARTHWAAMRQAILAPEPVRAFDLKFYLKLRQETGQSNTADARIRFLAPDFVRSIITQSQRELLRGPEGDWLLDNNEEIQLVGREGAEDRRQLDEIVGIARNFVALTDPASLRIAELEVLPEGPLGLPENGGVRERGLQLKWLAVTSPDFRLFQIPPRAVGAPPPMFRALLGLDPITHQVEMALIHEAGARSTLLATTILVHLQKLGRVEGFLVPGQIHVYQIDSQSLPARFLEKPSSELDLSKKGLDLRPTLTPADFLR